MNAERARQTEAGQPLRAGAVGPEGVVRRRHLAALEEFTDRQVELYATAWLDAGSPTS